jgi:hypothetical protein
MIVGREEENGKDVEEVEEEEEEGEGEEESNDGLVKQRWHMPRPKSKLSQHTSLRHSRESLFVCLFVCLFHLRPLGV